MLQGADLEGGEVYTTIYSSLNEMTWCPCVIYARDLRDILLGHITAKKLKGIGYLGIQIMKYLMPFNPLPSSMAFNQCVHNDGTHNAGEGDEDYAYFIDVKWVEK